MKRLIIGRITSAESIFHYTGGSTYHTYAKVDFRPLFLSELLANMTAAERTAAETKCGGNVECLFDYVVTGELTKPIAKCHQQSVNIWEKHCFLKGG